MADNEMTEHVSTSKMERFCARGLPETELTTVARHLANCSNCHGQFVATLGRHRETNPVTFTLAPEFWLRHEHIDYEHLVELADKKLDATDRELIDLHLKVCPSCSEDVQSFLAFREEIAPEMGVSYAPIERELAREGLSWVSWWRGLAWKPIYAAAVVLIGIALVIGVTLFLKRRADNLQVKQTQSPNVNLGAASQTPTPDNRAANGPSPPVMPNEAPVNANTSATITVLNDRAGLVTVDKGGNVSGLDAVPAPIRDKIAKALVSERIEPSSILKDLAGQDSTLRGGASRQPFKLLSPTRSVILSNRPNFKWDKVEGASAYRVYVNNLRGHEAATSEELPSEHTEWVVPKSLKRGEIYAWTVVAVVDGREIVSPGRSSPERKFQVLSTINLQQLNKIKKARSHLALGVFYVRVGMAAEAERELRKLVELNPNSKVASHLLRSVRK
jgi:hypothetical protein